MAWNPAIPATNADLLSAPVRDNFSALDTALMAALATLGNGALLTKAAGPVIAGISAVATGAVLVSAGLTTPPIWSASPALTDLMLGGGTIGTSGVGVLALGPATTPTTSPVDTVQLYTQDMDGQAGSRALMIRDERGSVLQIGTTVGEFKMSVVKSSVDTRWQNDGVNGGKIGTWSNNGMYFVQNGIDRIILSTDANIYLVTPGFALRAVLYGAPDSGGTGYRMMRVTN
jgi:hypothetical protein